MATYASDWDNPAQLKFFGAEADLMSTCHWDGAAEFATLREAVGIAIGRAALPGHAVYIRTQTGRVLPSETINDLWWELSAR